MAEKYLDKKRNCLRSDEGITTANNHAVSSAIEVDISSIVSSIASNSHDDDDDFSMHSQLSELCKRRDSICSDTDSEINQLGVRIHSELTLNHLINDSFHEKTLDWEEFIATIHSIDQSLRVKLALLALESVL